VFGAYLHNSRIARHPDGGSGTPVQDPIPAKPRAAVAESSAPLLIFSWSRKELRETAAFPTRAGAVHPS
jgi:hypothetical protein